MSHQTKAAQLAEKYQEEFFKMNPDGCTVAPYVNADLISAAFEAGFEAAKAELESLRTENEALIKAHNTQVIIAKEFQKLFVQVEPEMSALNAKLQTARDALKRIADGIDYHNCDEKARKALELCK